MPFENIQLMPSCLEKSRVGKVIFQCFSSVFSADSVEKRSNMQEYQSHVQTDSSDLASVNV